MPGHCRSCWARWKEVTNSLTLHVIQTWSKSKCIRPVVRDSWTPMLNLYPPIPDQWHRDPCTSLSTKSQMQLWALPTPVQGLCASESSSGFWWSAAPPLPSYEWVNRNWSLWFVETPHILLFWAGLSDVRLKEFHLHFSSQLKGWTLFFLVWCFRVWFRPLMPMVAFSAVHLPPHSLCKRFRISAFHHLFVAGWFRSPSVTLQNRPWSLFLSSYNERLLEKNSMKG